MNNISTILDSYKLRGSVFERDGVIYVHFDQGIYVPLECLDDIRERFPDRKITISGFFGDSGFGVKIT